MIGQLDEIDRKSMTLQKSENVREIEKFMSVIEFRKPRKPLHNGHFQRCMNAKLMNTI